MKCRRLAAAGALSLAATLGVRAGDPGPTQAVSPDANAYSAPVSAGAPFPDGYYGADHGGSTLALVYPYAGPFGYADHSHGRIVYSAAPFTPRGSEGVFGMDVWLEQQDSSGNWSPAALNGGVPDQGYTYQPVNTPNPGPSPSYMFTWSFNPARLPPNTNFRVFVYVYVFNQGGGSQGDFPVASSTSAVNPGAANDPPRISWTAAGGTVNPQQVSSGQTYTISADAQDDNGDLVAVRIDKGGQPFAYAGGGNGYSGNSQNPTSDPPGSITFTAWAIDAAGAQSAVITRTVSAAGKSNQPPVGSAAAEIAFSQAFTPQVFGGAGSGGWQFCVAGYTNWDAGASAYTGTNLGPSPGSSPGALWAANWTPPAAGAYAFYVARDGDSNYNPSGISGPYTLTVDPQPQPPPPPVATLTASPSAGTAPLTTTISWTSARASAVTVTGAGVSGTALAGSQTATLSVPGTYAYALSATGTGGQTSLSTSVTVAAPQYTLSLYAVGPGSVSGAGTYPANAWVAIAATPGAGAAFSGWTGSVTSASTPLLLPMTGNLTVFANFSSLQPQAILFAPPPTATFPGPAIALSATASSGLPVSLALVSGPALLVGGQLTPTGAGPVVVQASQGGNSVWLPASPVTAVITVNAAGPVARIRFNAAGRDARVTGSPLLFGTSALWTDPAGLLASPWPPFANPLPAQAGSSNVVLPAVPPAQQ